MENYSFKELYDIKIKSIFPMDVGDRHFEEGEVLLAFDKIDIANITEKTQEKTAKGGYDARSFINWEEKQEIDFVFSQGVFNQQQLAFLWNSHLIIPNGGAQIILSKREVIETDVEGFFELSQTPCGKMFCYDKDFSKLDYEKKDEKTFKITEPYKEIIVDYEYSYTNKASSITIGRNLYNGYVSLEAKTRTVEDITGNIKTAILKIPRLQINSNLNVALGTNRPPLAALFTAKAYPIGKHAQKKIIDFIVLSDDIDSDIQ